MELGEAGEALFIEEEIATSLPPIRHLEPSDSSIFLDPDNALSLNSNPQLSNIDCSPQIINKQLDTQKSYENHESIPKYAYEQPIVPSVDVDVLNSNTTISNSRRRLQKRRPTNTINKQSSEEEDQEIEKFFSSTKRRSRARQRDSTPTSLNGNLSGENNTDQSDSSLTLLRKRSASENDLPFFPIDDEKQSESSTPFVDAHSRINSIDSRKKLLIIPPRVTFESDHDGEDESDSSSPENSIRENGIDQRTARTLSNPIPIEQKQKDNDGEESNTPMNTIFSQSAPLGNLLSTVPIRISQSTDLNSYYLNENFSPTSAFDRFISQFFFSN